MSKAEEKFRKAGFRKIPTQKPDSVIYRDDVGVEIEFDLKRKLVCVDMLMAPVFFSMKELLAIVEFCKEQGFIIKRGH